jgi:3-oxoacyl-[acyl-carrier protein] reductase
MKLQDKVAIITGAGSGIGRAVALRFASEGARVAVTDVDEASARDAAAAIEKGHALALRLDVTDSAQVRAAFDRVTGTWGRLDVLVNNAGVAGFAETNALDDDTWRKVMAVHLDGTFYCTREALRLMTAGAKIINMASICGMMGWPMAAHYSAAKGGIIAFTKAVAREAVLRGIYVNAIAPGFIETPMITELMPGWGDAVSGMIATQIPLGRLGTPDEIASLALYLASDESSFIVGQIISPNGGHYI